MSVKKSLPSISTNQPTGELVCSDLEFARTMKSSFDQAGAFGLMYAITAPLLQECLGARGGAGSGIVSSIIGAVGKIPGVPDAVDYKLFQQGEAGKLQREIKEELGRTIQGIGEDYNQMQAELAQIFSEEFPALAR